MKLLDLVLELGLVLQLSTEIVDLVLQLRDESRLSLLICGLLLGLGLQAPA